MAECIEREKVLELIGNFKRDDVTEHCVDYAAGWNEALEQIECNVEEDIPAADVRPERHGEWIFEAPNAIGFLPVRCSNCGIKIATTASPRDWINEPDHVYCGACGAKMSREGETNGSKG